MQKIMTSCSEDRNIDFREEFERIYNNDEIPEADDEDYTPDSPEDTQFKMEVVCPEMVKAWKLLSL